MFENLTSKLQLVLKKLTGKGKLSEPDVDEALREIRLVLLEADVNFKVVKDFITKIRQRAIGQEILDSLTPGQQVIRIVRDELTDLLGGIESSLSISSKPPAVIMLVGLHGSGKTTTAGKLANYLKGQGHHPLLVATDIYRPAAIKQLQVIGERVGIPVFSVEQKEKPVDIAKASISFSKSQGRDLIIIDTAGRLHIDEELMRELQDIKDSTAAQEILLVLDAMTGQDAVNIGLQFEQSLELSGFVLTKLDGDARGGAALSLRQVTGKPIKFVGVGEKLDAIELFHPDRMASRILGMGDILSLIEKAEAAFEDTKIEDLERKIKEKDFNLEDYLEQIKKINKIGPIDQFLNLIPGIGKMMKSQNLQIDERNIKHMAAIIESMTGEERKNPSLLNGKRKRRIAAGSGTNVQKVNLLLSQFQQMKMMLRQAEVMEKGNIPNIIWRR